MTKKDQKDLELRKAVLRLAKGLYKSLSSAPGQGGDLIVPMMGSTVIPFPRKTIKKGNKISKSRPVKKKEMFRELPINVEILPGDVKSGVDPNGEPWKVRYDFPYGEIAGTTTLADGEAVDVYLGPNPNSDVVYVVHQLKPDGQFDEDKVFLGFDNPEQAVQVYYDHGPDWGFGSAEDMTWDQFVNGYLVSNRLNGWMLRLPPVVKSKKISKSNRKPENDLEKEIAKHPFHPNEKWEDKFRDTFNISKFDSGGVPDPEIKKLYEGLVLANIPRNLWADYPANKELHIEKPTESAPTIKGYFQDHEEHGKEGVVYLFYRALDYLNRPYRLPGVYGAWEIIVHEIGHFLSYFPLRQYTKEFQNISGWIRTPERAAVPKGYIRSKQNPHWIRRADATFSSEYAEKALNEDWAESWAAYVFRPDILKAKCPQKWEFFKKYVGPIENQWWKKYSTYRYR